MGPHRLFISSLLMPLAVLAGGNDSSLFDDGFEDRLDPLFPTINGAVQLPPGPTVDQLNWILSELASGEDTTSAEVADRFVPAFDAQAIADFIDSLRGIWPDAIVVEVIGVSPVQLTVVIDTPTGRSPQGLVNLSAQYSGEQQVTFFQVQDYFGSVQFPDDQNLSLTAAVDELVTVAPDTSVLVARVNDQNQCIPIEDRQADTLRGTGSIFKNWVLGAVGQAIEEGQTTPDEVVTLVASELAPSGTINSEPLGTPFPVSDLATLMMAISDNTATDLLHELVGRAQLEQFVNQSGVADADVLNPLLSINEQFHLFFSFPLTESESYVNGTEAFQQSFLTSEIEPLGPVTSFPFFHADLLDDGSWQASPNDVCAVLAKLRTISSTNGAFDVVDRALGAQAAWPSIRNLFDRVWFKGGSLADAVGFRVYTGGWLLETQGRDPYVLVVMANRPDPGTVDVGVVQSLTARIMHLLAEMP